MAGGGAAQVPDGNAGDNGNAQLVRNELLSFVTQKLNYMPTDSIVQLCAQFYGEEVICHSQSLLVSSNQWNVVPQCACTFPFQAQCHYTRWFACQHRSCLFATSAAPRVKDDACALMGKPSVFSRTNTQ